MLMLGLAVALWLRNGEIQPTSKGFPVAVADAVVGRPGDTGQLCRRGQTLHRRTRRARPWCCAWPGVGAPGPGVHTRCGGTRALALAPMNEAAP